MKNSTQFITSAIIAFQIVFPTTGFAQNWFTSKNGAQVRITDGNFSHGRDPNGPGYDVETASPPVNSLYSRQQFQLIYGLNELGQLEKKILGEPSHPLSTGIINANIYPNSLAWAEAAELLKIYVTQYLVPLSGIDTNSGEARKAVENVADISIPTLEFIEKSRLDVSLLKSRAVTKKELKNFKEMVLIDPITILILAAEYRIKANPRSNLFSSVDIANVNKLVSMIRANRDSRFLGFLESKIIPGLVAHSKVNDQWRFDSLRSPTNTLYMSAYAEQFAAAKPAKFQVNVCKLKVSKRAK
ncbi:MAG: hypothetical protein ACK5V3_09115 [Bdellovibrionales bacterium]